MKVGCHDFFYIELQSYCFGNMPNFKIVAYLLLGCTDSGGYVKFTPKYITVGGEGGVSDFLLSFQSRSFEPFDEGGVVLF